MSVIYFLYSFCTNKDSLLLQLSSAVTPSVCITRSWNFGSPLLTHYARHRSNKKEFTECAKTTSFTQWVTNVLAFLVTYVVLRRYVFTLLSALNYRSLTAFVDGIAKRSLSSTHTSEIISLSFWDKLNTKSFTSKIRTVYLLPRRLVKSVFRWTL